ncbi:hypothetical protein CFAM422_005893 [Trichoderma lentiforme]|uniref:Uncharacterized protein n=1 Tax=Trichoderma lentiforme TaxID=1567552 RepID=A0A9P4XGT5_9HYPO|nr:hypothetical protein CFAM422_005893 [Trichoderma lentiforme]
MARKPAFWPRHTCAAPTTTSPSLRSLQSSIPTVVCTATLPSPLMAKPAVVRLVAVGTMDCYLILPCIIESNLFAIDVLLNIQPGHLQSCQRDLSGGSPDHQGPCQYQHFEYGTTSIALLFDRPYQTRFFALLSATVSDSRMNPFEINLRGSGSKAAASGQPSLARRTPQANACVSFGHAMAGSPAVERDPYGGRLRRYVLQLGDFYFLGKHGVASWHWLEGLMGGLHRGCRELAARRSIPGGRAKAGLEPGLFRVAGLQCKCFSEGEAVVPTCFIRGGNPEVYEHSDRQGITLKDMMAAGLTSLPWNSRWLRVAKQPPTSLHGEAAMDIEDEDNYTVKRVGVKTIQAVRGDPWSVKCVRPTVISVFRPVEGIDPNKGFFQRPCRSTTVVRNEESRGGHCRGMSKLGDVHPFQPRDNRHILQHVMHAADDITFWTLVEIYCTHSSLKQTTHHHLQ